MARRIFTLLVILNLISPAPASSQIESYRRKGTGPLVAAPASATTAIQLPFEEEWSSGSFSTNGWTFSTPDHNWSIDPAIGNPSPCAVFNGLPTRFDYEQVLISDTIDASIFTCADIRLDFDLMLATVSTTGQERLAVEVSSGGSWQPVAEFQNLQSTVWQPLSLTLDSVAGSKFRFRFVTRGSNSAEIQRWAIDNINVYGKCRGPRNLTAFGSTGGRVWLQWQPPACNMLPPGMVSIIIYDDDTWETGYRDSPGNQSWLGNYFPMEPFSSGVILQVQLYFIDDGSGTQQTLALDFFDQNHTLTGSSAPFSAGPKEQWLNVPVDSIPFSGSFNAMVRYDNPPALPYFLASDENGPNASQDLEKYRDNLGVWHSLTEYGLPPGVFLIRVKALIYSDNPGQADSTILLGFNVYRSSIGGGLPFVKRNAVPVNSLHYVDTLPAGTPWHTLWKYYTTAVFQDSSNSLLICEGESSVFSYYFSSADGSRIPNCRIWPNPASVSIRVESGEPVTGAVILDLTGREILTLYSPGNSAFDISVQNLARGTYILKLLTRNGIRQEKFVLTE